MSIDVAGVRALARRLDEASAELDDLVRRAGRLDAAGVMARSGGVARWQQGHAERLRTAARIAEDLEAEQVDWQHDLALHGLPTDLADLAPGRGDAALTGLEHVLDELPDDASAADRAAAVAGYFRGLTPLEQAWLATHASQTVGNLDGVPNQVRYAANRMTIERTLDEERTRYDAWQPPPAEGTDDRVTWGLLAERIARYQELLRTEELSTRTPDGGRTSTEAGRSFLVFAPPQWDPTGSQVVDDGRLAEVLGNLDTAAHIGVLVPGITNRIDNVDGLVRNGEELRRAAGEDDLAVVVWLGYDTPEFAEAVSTSRAEQGAPALISLVAGMQRWPGSDVTVFAHSYGTVTTSQAIQGGMLPDRIVLMGSPGLGRDIHSAADLGLPDGYPIFAMRAPGDWVSYTESHGDDPVEMPGVTRLDTGWPGTVEAHGHSEYYLHESGALANLALLLQGRIPPQEHWGGDGIVQEQHGGLVVRRLVAMLNERVPPAEQLALVADLEPIIERMEHGGESWQEALPEIATVLAEHDAADLYPDVKATLSLAIKEEAARWAVGSALDGTAGALRLFSAGTSVLTDAVQTGLRTAVDWSQAQADQRLDWFQRVLRGGTDAVQDGADLLVDGAQQVGRDAVDGVQGLGNRVVDSWQRSPLGPVVPLSPLLPIPVPVPDAWVDTAQGGVNALVDGGQDALDQVTDVLQVGGRWLTDTGQDVLDTVLDGAQTGVTTMVDDAQDLGDAVLDGAQHVAGDVVDGVTDTLGGWADSVFGG